MTDHTGPADADCTTFMVLGQDSIAVAPGEEGTILPVTPGTPACIAVVAAIPDNVFQMDDIRNAIEMPEYIWHLQDPGTVVVGGMKMPRGSFSPPGSRKHYPQLYKLGSLLEKQWHTVAKWPKMPKNGSECRKRIVKVLFDNRLEQGRSDVDNQTIPDLLSPA